MYIARFDKDRIQQLNKHITNVGEYCSRYANNLGLSNTLRLCGYLHDMGKYSDEFQSYINKAKEETDKGTINDWEKTVKKVDHAVYGAKYIYEFTGEHKVAEMARGIIAEAICYHHGGLPDNIDDDGHVPLLSRIDKVDKNTYKIVTKRFFDEIDIDVSDVFKKACNEIEAVFVKMKKPNFELGLLIKNIYSILVDADRWDSFLFSSGSSFDDNNDIIPLWEEYSRNLENKLSEFKKYSPETESEKKVQTARRMVSDDCMDFSDSPTGIYTLTVPTGGGKTLSSLRFALNHAVKNKKSRIIYVIPFTSIIEQNAQEIRDVLKCDNKLLEYHSNILDCNKNTDYEILSERWNSPIIFTTMVQFLNSIFASGNNNIRRMHNLENAVIIFDEIQALPIKCIKLFYSTIEYLKNICNTTSVLCTATQPDMDFISNKLKIKISDGEIIRDKKSIFSALKRMTVVDKTDVEMTYEEVSDFAIRIKSEASSLLLIVNTVYSAEKIFDLLKNQSETSVYLLTSRMCAFHRKKVLDEVRKKLKDGENIICVSTQLIEAGVDISFQAVIRSLAGLDSIAQATGRGNRHGECENGKSYIIKIADENTEPLREIKIGQCHTLNLIALYNKNIGEYDDSLLSEKSIQKYYQEYYSDGEIEQNMSYPIGKNTSIYELLNCTKKSRNIMIKNNPHLPFTYNFKTAAVNFNVIDDLTTSVIVPYDDKAKDLIGRFIGNNSLSEKYLILKEMQRYTVNIYSNMLNKLVEENAFIPSPIEGVYILKDSYYSLEKGLNVNKSFDNSNYIF